MITESFEIFNSFFKVDFEVQFEEVGESYPYCGPFEKDLLLGVGIGEGSQWLSEKVKS